MISDKSVVSASKDQVSSDLGEEVVILSIKDGMYYGLDPVGARIWELIQEPRNVGEIHGILVEEYDVDADRCKNDLLNLLQDLASKNLIEVRES